MAYQQGQQAAWYNGQSLHELGKSVNVSYHAGPVQGHGLHLGE